MRKIGHIAGGAIMVIMALGSISAAIGKAHDQGVADGAPGIPGAQNAKQTIDFLTSIGKLDGKGVSALQKDGVRGEISSTDKGAGRVVPVVNHK